MVDISPISAQLPWILRLVIASLCGALIGYRNGI